MDVAGLWPLRGAQGLDPCGKCKAARPLNAALGYGLGGPEGVGLSSMPMACGAGHDTSFLARICPAAMVFVPCRQELSHHADEWAEPADLAAGATVLLETIEAIDHDKLG